MSRIMMCILMGLTAWPIYGLACVPVEVGLGHRCARVTMEQCALAYRNVWPVVVLGRVKEAFIDPHPITRLPGFGGKTRYAYAEIEVLDTLKGKPPTSYIARIAEGECGAYGPFTVGEVGLFGLWGSPVEGPAVFSGYKQTQAQARQLMPTINYFLAHRWPDVLKAEELLEFLRKQVNE